ncbi:Uncharacterised protein [Moraxella ovis]|uniref:hypothetical protein n=2 Tax=Moraxella ovis TaxID=29433 RepID=UPI000D89EDCA|nr:hypothetical protein [Moraxella ovis]SPX81040.1 Uncharacterised protein [Moraxella ovis]STZ05982.1 Uncharacterised protein [Moraxella ovis]
MPKIYQFEKMSIITAIDSTLRFQDSFPLSLEKYSSDVLEFIKLTNSVNSTEELLHQIRQSSINKEQRMTFLKLFRRCVSTVIDTETSKKINKVPTQVLIDAYGQTFIDIYSLKQFLNTITPEQFASLCCLLSEYDNRGNSGYILTSIFFNWFNDSFANEFSIQGPVSAGKDIELSSVVSDFTDSSFPCDFIIRCIANNEILAVGFSRYDSTRGGAQSDDRTGGNTLKVEKLKQYEKTTGNRIKIIFLSDGPGLAHNDTWQETCLLADSWGDNVRVTTMKIAHQMITRDWLLSK